MTISGFDNKYDSVFLAETYCEFRKRLLGSDCHRCELGDNRTNIVVDRGNENASLVVIGEGPGENEDMEGRAFVGRAGKMLDKVMANVGLDTDQDMLILNIVKCRPPGNRAPKTGEAAACMPFLKKQIALVKPEIIVLLGATALKRIRSNTKSFSMRSEVGRFFSLPDYPSAELFTLYHPAALLYNPKLRGDMEKHLKLLKKRLNEISRAR